MNILNIRSYGKFGSTHSWSHAVRSILYEFYKSGHNLYISSTDGYSFANNDMEKFFNKSVKNADIDFCYTLPINFNKWFDDSSKIKLSIFNWESSVIPREWIDNHKHVDFILPSSNIVRDIFLQSGWPENKIKVVPLGVDWDHFKSSESLKINGLNKFKFLNVSIPHYRKNIDLVVEAYYDAFCHDDDVSLIIKTDLNKPKNYFECYVPDLIKKCQQKFFGKRLPKIHLIVDKYKDMAPLYRMSDCLVSASSFEGFGLPMIEAIAAGCQVIAPGCSGQLDFLNNENAFLLGVKKIPAEKKYQYWKDISGAHTFIPDSSDISQKMLDVFNGQKKSYNKSLEDIFSWKNSATEVIKLYENF